MVEPLIVQKINDQHSPIPMASIDSVRLDLDIRNDIHVQPYHGRENCSGLVQESREHYISNAGYRSRGYFQTDAHQVA